MSQAAYSAGSECSPAILNFRISSRLCSSRQSAQTQSLRNRPSNTYVRKNNFWLCLSHHAHFPTLSAIVRTPFRQPLQIPVVLVQLVLVERIPLFQFRNRSVHEFIVRIVPFVIPPTLKRDPERGVVYDRMRNLVYPCELSDRHSASPTFLR